VHLFGRLLMAPSVAKVICPAQQREQRNRDPVTLFIQVAGVADFDPKSMVNCGRR
jgi:hypothetical protein